MLELLVPCTERELFHLGYFLYDGEIQCQDESESIKIQENLNKIFGFPQNLNLFASDQVSSNETLIDNGTVIDPGDFF